MNLRHASIEDAQALAEFNINMARETEEVELIPEVILAGVEAMIKNPQMGFYLVVEDQGEIAASLMVTTEWSDWRNGLFWWIQSVYVRPQNRRQGLYRQLYQRVKTLAENETRVCGFRLYVEHDNKAAQSTYRSLGMEETDYKLYEELKPDTRVKLKKEIVTMGVEGFDPNTTPGTYVRPEDWNALISDPRVTVIDTRNAYESAIGGFDRATLANTATFREFPQYVSDHLDPTKNRKVAMFCTGGIRCEKSTAYLRQQGFEEVFHLQGGILSYLEKVPDTDSLWQGECFVFDNRVSVGHGLEKGSYDQCHACRLPITEADKKSDKYLRGISCPACHDRKSDAERERFREREKQVQLAKQRGESHIGSTVAEFGQRRKQVKLQAKNRQRNPVTSE